MGFRSLWALSSALALGLASCATSNSPPPDSSVPEDASIEPMEYEGSFAQELIECQLYDEACLSRVQDIRHQRQVLAKLDELLAQGETIRQEQEQQHAERLRAINKAAGLDPDAGTGFWCFSGEFQERTLTECKRTWEECADHILRREREGLKIADRRCEEYAQAACLRVTRTLKEGERVMCYGDMATCESFLDRLGSERVVSRSDECRISD